MSIHDNIFRRDLARLADDAPKPIGRPNSDPNFLAEANYFLEHGMSREQAREMNAARRRDDFEAEAVADLNAAPPDYGNTRGLGKARSALANFFEWQHREAKRRDDLLARKAELEAMIAAPAETETKIRDAVRQTATSLMGRAHAGETINRAALDVQLSTERHQSEAAKIAIAEIDRQIEKAELRVARINERESEFLNPALIEIADDELKLGQLLMKKIAEVRAVTDLLNGLAHVAGEYGSGFGQPSTINFTKVGLPSLADTPSAAYTIPSAGNDATWEACAKALKMNPRMDASKFVSVPKG